MERIQTTRTARVPHTDDAAIFFFCELDRETKNDVLKTATLPEWRAFVDAIKMKTVSTVIAPSPLAGRIRIAYPCKIRPGDRYILQTIFDGGSVFRVRARIEIFSPISRANAWGEE